MSTFIQIPLDSNFSSFRETVSLSNKSIILEFNWNERMARWHLSIFDANEGLILAGIPLHVDRDLVGRFRLPSMPQGYFLMFDVTKQMIEIDRDELGERGVLLFTPREEAA